MFSNWGCNNHEHYRDLDSYKIKIKASYGNVDPVIKNGHKYYPLKHNTNYSILLTNNTNKRCNVSLKVDSRNIGKWRIDPFDTISLERPSRSERRFVFVKENSWQGNMGGLIEAKFIPEKNALLHDYHNEIKGVDDGMGQMRNCENTNMFVSGIGSMPNIKKNAFGNYSSGGTVFGERSEQRFGDASRMIEDQTQSVTKKIRLIVDNKRRGLPFAPIDTVDVPRHERAPPRWNSGDDDDGYRTPARYDPFDYDYPFRQYGGR